MLPLAFTAFRQQSYAASEDGERMTSAANVGLRAALCSEVVMNSRKSCAEVKVVQMASPMMIGVARPTVDVSAQTAYNSAGFWGMYSNSGMLFRAATGHLWQGKHGYAAGDVLRLLLDSDAGTLTVKKNGPLLGVAVTQGLKGDLCWAARCASRRWTRWSYEAAAISACKT